MLQENLLVKLFTMAANYILALSQQIGPANSLEMFLCTIYLDTYLEICEHLKNMKIIFVWKNHSFEYLLMI